MTLDQIEHVLRELGWRGKPGTGPEVHINHNAEFGPLWIEQGLVVFDGCLSGKRWMAPHEVTSIRPTSSERPAPLRVVED